MNRFPTIQDKERSRFQLYRSQFAEFYPAIEMARITFTQEKIWPDQCDYIIYKIKPLQKTANTIASFAKSENKQRDRRTISNTYPILVSAHYLCDQLDMLIVSIQEFKETMENKSSHRSRHKSIVNSLHALDLSLNDLMKELNEVTLSS